MLLLVFEYVKAYILLMRDLVLFYAALADENRLRLLNLDQARGDLCLLLARRVANEPAQNSRHLAYLRKPGWWIPGVTGNGPTID